MEVILVDTSVWINFLKNVNNQATMYLEEQIKNKVIATCPTIVQEVLQGVLLDSDYNAVKNYLDQLLHLEYDAYLLAIEAANLYRSLRKKGITIRKPNDCLIAIYAITNNATLLNDDRDFRLIAQHSALKVVSFE